MTREVYILLGQSNMRGSGVVPTPAPTYANISRIWTYTQPWNGTQPCDAANPGGGTWVQGKIDPIHSGPGCGVGPGLAFADRLSTMRGDPTLEIGLVPCSWSGSQLCRWTGPPNPGAPWDTTYRLSPTASYNLSPFAMTVARMRTATTWGPIRGALLAIGETDSLLVPNENTGNYYYMVSEYLRLVRDVRFESGSNLLPVIGAKVGPLPAALFPSAPYFNAYLDQIARTDPRLRIIETADFAMEDQYHYAPASRLLMGQRYADAMMLAQS